MNLLRALLPNTFWLTERNGAIWHWEDIISLKKTCTPIRNGLWRKKENNIKREIFKLTITSRVRARRLRKGHECLRPIHTITFTVRKNFTVNSIFEPLVTISATPTKNSLLFKQYSPLFFLSYICDMQMYNEEINNDIVYVLSMSHPMLILTKSAVAIVTSSRMRLLFAIVIFKYALWFRLLLN